MRKNKEYISDVHQKITELHKLVEVALRKELEQWKLPFPPSGQYFIISNQQKMFENCLEEDVCLYRPNARWEGEFEWLKTLHGPQLRIAETIVESRGQKTFKKKMSNSTYITTCRLWGFQEKLSYYPVFSNLIRHYRRTCRAVKLPNGGFKKYWIKGCR